MVGCKKRGWDFGSLYFTRICKVLKRVQVTLTGETVSASLFSPWYTILSTSNITNLNKCYTLDLLKITDIVWQILSERIHKKNVFVRREKSFAPRYHRHLHPSDSGKHEARWAWLELGLASLGYSASMPNTDNVDNKHESKLWETVELRDVRWRRSQTMFSGWVIDGA